MCIIVDNRVGKKLPEHIVNNCIQKNQDGFAIYLMKEKRLIKTLDKNEFRTHFEKETPFVAHCRFKTKGSVCKENIHLFEEGSWLFAMNGTVNGFRDGDANDTRELIKLLRMIPDPKNQIRFLRSWAARFLIIDRNTNQIVRTGKWLEKDGVYYSKDNVFDEPKKNYHHNQSRSHYPSHSSQQSSSQKRNAKNRRHYDLSDYDRDLGNTDSKFVNTDEWIEIDGIMCILSNLERLAKDDESSKKNLFDKTEKEEREKLQKAEGKKEGGTNEDEREFGFTDKRLSCKTSAVVGVYGHLKIVNPLETSKILKQSRFICKAKTVYSLGMVLSKNYKPFLLDRIIPLAGSVSLELYIIPVEDLKKLDILMKHPQVFNRKKIAATDIGGRKFRPNVYVLSNKTAVDKLDNKHYFNNYSLEQEELCLSLRK